MKTLVQGRIQAKGTDISKAKSLEHYSDYRENVLARLLPEQPPPQPSAEEVLTNALNNCSRTLAYVHQQSFCRAQQKHSLIKMQYGCNPAVSGASDESSADSAKDKDEESEEAHWLEPDQRPPAPRHAAAAAAGGTTGLSLGSAAPVASRSRRASVRSLTRTWTAVTIPTILVDMDPLEDGDDARPLSPSESPSMALLRLHQNNRRAPVTSDSNPGFAVTNGVGGSVDPTAAAGASASSPAASLAATIPRGGGSAAAGWLPHDAPAPAAPQLAATTSPNGTWPKLPALPICRQGRDAVPAVGTNLVSPRPSATTKPGGGGGGDGDDTLEDNDEADDAPSSDLLIRPPGLDSALSCLRPPPLQQQQQQQQQQPPRAPRLQRHLCKSLEMLSDLNGLAAARHTADNTVTAATAAAASAAAGFASAPGFASTGGNVSVVVGGGDDEEGDELSGEWLMYQGGARSVPQSPHSGASSGALKPTPRAPSRLTAAAMPAPMVPRSKWPASPRATCGSTSLASSSLPAHQHQHQHQHQPQHQQPGQSRQPDLSPTGAMWSASPPTDAARQLRKTLSSLSSASVAGAGAAAAAAASRDGAPPTPTAHHQPQVLSSPSPSTSTPVPSLMSYLLTNADRPPWKFARADSSLQQRSDSSIDFVRSISRKPSMTSNQRGPPLQLSSVGRSGGGAGSGTGGVGGVGRGAAGQGPERSWQTGSLASPATSLYGDLQDAAQDHAASSMTGGAAAAAVGPSPRRQTVSSMNSPTGHPGRPGSSLLSPAATSLTGGASQPHVRFRQHHHHQSASSAHDNHLFRPLCCEDLQLPGSPTTSSSGVSPVAAMTPEQTKRGLSQSNQDEPQLASLIVTASGGSSGGGGAAAGVKKHVHGSTPAPPTAGMPLPQQQQQYHPQPPHLVPGLSSNQHRRAALLRKLSDGDLALPGGGGGGGGQGGGAAAAAGALAAAESLPGGGRAQPYRAGGVGGGAAGTGGGGSGARGGGDGGGVGPSELDGAEGLMARLFKTLNDLRRMESAQNKD